jgi:putative hydrolase of the HAD superfamily
MPEPLDLSPFRAVYFDAVGTVLFPCRSAPSIYASVAQQYGLDVSADEVKKRFSEAYYRQEKLDELANWVTEEAREVARWQAIVTETLPTAPPECFTRLYQYFAEPDAWTVPPEAVLLFEKFHKLGMQLGLASNYDLRLRSVLAGRPELDLLKANVLISSVVGIRKPGRAFFQQVCRQTNLAAEQILFIGDDVQNDYEGARSAGMQAILLDARDQHPEISNRIASLADLLS